MGCVFILFAENEFLACPDKYYPACQSGIHLLFCRIALCCLLQTIAGLMLVWDFVLYLQEKIYGFVS
jgi:hypothetical protein